MRTPDQCSKCQQDQLRQIIYGLVRDGELREKAERGEVVLAGSLVERGSPNWDCPTCERQFREEELDGTPPPPGTDLRA